jgi:hypothetical protein
MAVELMGQEPFYVPTLLVAATDESESDEDTDEPESDPNAPVYPNFYHNLHHNFQHDVESFFWLFLWMLTGRVRDEKLQDYSKLIFQNSLHSCPYRRRVIRQSQAELQHLRNISPQEMQVLFRPIWEFAAELYRAYLYREDKFEDLTTYCGIIYKGYRVLKSSLDRIRKSEISMLNDLKVYTTSSNAGLGIAPQPPVPDDVPKPLKTMQTRRSAVADDGDYEPSEGSVGGDEQPARSTKRARRE